jgi:hypothetical protein
MRPFDRLLYASEGELMKLFQSLRAPPAARQDLFLDEVAQSLGLEREQLVCACGFNPHLLGVPSVVSRLGFSGFPALWRTRDEVFVEDAYRVLSIDDILAIYALIGRGDGDAAFSNLIQRRLNHIEEQIEATINPITLGSYKLEVRSIYEHNLLSRDFIEWRMEGNYAVLRRLSNEVTLMIATGIIKPAEMVAAPGITVEEKTRLLHDHLVSAEDVLRYLDGAELPDAEREALEQAVRQLPAA